MKIYVVIVRDFEMVVEVRAFRSKEDAKRYAEENEEDSVSIMIHEEDLL